MTDAQVIAALVDRSALALTAWAEARGIPRNDPHDHSPVEELIAVMSVVRNRRQHAIAKGQTPTYRDLCLAPWQFSCWNAGVDANHLALLAQAHRLVDATATVPIDPELAECLVLADGIIDGAIIDRTGGATSYYAPAAMQPPGRVPSWAAGKSFLEIGDQYFVKV